MRMRFKPYARPELEAASFYTADPIAQKGNWHGRFANPAAPLCLELGCGKGGFVSRLASRNPQNNYIGIDITDKVLILAKRNIDRQYAEAELEPTNVTIMNLDIERILNAFDETDTVNRIYINFCNPWNQRLNQKKHRLTHTRQLALYRQFLAQDGEVYFKTDDDNLFADSLAYFEESGFEIIWKTYDLHADEPEWNIRTEHEGMFTEQGIKTKALIAAKRPLANEAEHFAETIRQRTAKEKADSAAYRETHGIQ